MVVYVKLIKLAAKNCLVLPLNLFPFFYFFIFFSSSRPPHQYYPHLHAAGDLLEHGLWQCGPLRQDVSSAISHTQSHAGLDSGERSRGKSHFIWFSSHSYIPFSILIQNISTIFSMIGVTVFMAAVAFSLTCSKGL